MVDETSGLLFELGAEGVEERDDGTLAKTAAAGKVTLVAAFATPRGRRAGDRRARRGLAPSLRGDRRRRVARRVEGALPALRDRARPRRRRAVVVRPPWEAYEAKPGEHVLELEPGRAFGTGLHETTRLVAPGARRSRERARRRDRARRRLRQRRPRARRALARRGARGRDRRRSRGDRRHARERRAQRDDAIASTRARPTLDALDLTRAVVVANIEARVLIPMARRARARTSRRAGSSSSRASSSRSRTTCARRTPTWSCSRRRRSASGRSSRFAQAA